MSERRKKHPKELEYECCEAPEKPEKALAKCICMKGKIIKFTKHMDIGRKMTKFYNYTNVPPAKELKTERLILYNTNLYLLKKNY